MTKGGKELLVLEQADVVLKPDYIKIRTDHGFVGKAVYQRGHQRIHQQADHDQHSRTGKDPPGHLASIDAAGAGGMAF